MSDIALVETLQMSCVEYVWETGGLLNKIGYAQGKDLKDQTAGLWPAMSG